jgi:phosphoethanolamine N-methyltransferase
MAEEYDDRMVAMLELIWGKGFLAPGGAAYVREHLAGLDLAGRTVLDVGSGLGGGALLMAGELGAKVIGLDIEAPLVEGARRYAEEAGLSGRVEYRLVQPGPFPLPDRAVDLVYSSGAFTQIADKESLFIECLRVLRPGGRLVVYDWMTHDGSPSAAMQYFYKLEGLTYAMRPLAAHGALLRAAGFVEIELEDLSDWYRREARREWERMRGPLFPVMAERLGQAGAEHFVENWKAMVAVLDMGELRPGRYRARRPEAR